MTAAPGGLADVLLNQIELAVMGEQMKGRTLHPRDVAQVAVTVMEQWGCPNCPDPANETYSSIREEVRRHRAANLVRAVIDGYGRDVEFINEAINADDFDRVPWLVADRALTDRRELLSALRPVLALMACDHMPRLGVEVDPGCPRCELMGPLLKLVRD